MEHGIEQLLGVPGTFGVELDGQGFDGGAGLGQGMLDLGQGDALAAARVRDADPCAGDIERVEDAGEGGVEP